MTFFVLFRHITIVVKQGQDEKPFPLRAFLRDLLSPVSMKDISYEKEADALVKVFILTGRTAGDWGFEAVIYLKLLLSEQLRYLKYFRN